ncbi:MAG TPA: HIT family protein [Bacteroidales bacterium]|nr:HIT family protein [Bacteroidales bacterium]HPT01217.1 HIT family protein [Bacteroidales bacterium]
MSKSVYRETECPFCVKEFSEAAFLADDDFLAVYNIAPILPGHSLIVPRKHVRGLSDLNDDETARLFVFAKKTTNLLMAAFHGEGFDWSLQEKEAAGQTVPHLHLHIVIRKTGDLKDIGEWYPRVDHADNHLLDSFSRPKLCSADYRQITAYLRKTASLF